MYDAGYSKPVLCDKLEVGWEVQRVQQEGIYVHLMQIHVGVWQNKWEYCNVLSSNLKN